MSVVDIISLIGIPALIGGFLYIGRKLQMLDDLKETTGKIKANVKVIGDFLVENAGLDPSELRNYSPLRLTPEGEKLIRDLGFYEVFEEHKQEFFDCIDSEHPKLKYDVEIAAIKSISLLSDMDFMSFLKIFLYENPERNFGNTAPTLGIYLRDKYLAAHPEITQ